MRRAILPATWAFLLLAHPAWVRADPIVQVRDYSITMIGQDPVPFTQILFDQFNPQQGELSGVTFVFELTLRSLSIDYENRRGIPVTVNIQNAAGASYVGPSLVNNDAAPSDAIQVFQADVNLGPFDGVSDFSGPDAFNFRQLTPLTTGSMATPVSFLPYIGAGSVPLQIVGFYGTGVTEPITVRLNSAELAGTITLRYSSSVPESSTLYLCGSGLVLVGLATYRRRRREANAPFLI